MRDIFKSVPAEGAIERDWTSETIVVDMQNALGEKFHFEVTPDGSEKVIIAPKGGNTGWGGSCQLDVTLPIV